MKKTNYIAPTTVLLFLFSGIGMLGVSLANLIGMGTEGNKTGAIIVSAVSVLFSVASIIFSIWFIKNRKLQKGDEFTTKVVQQSGFIAFYLNFFLTFVFFAVLQFVAVWSKDADTVNNFGAVIGANTVSIGVVSIQVGCTILFAVTAFLKLKNGDVENIGDTDETENQN